MFLVSLASVAFISLGLPDGLLGVAWPSMRASFGLPIDALGALLVATTTGYVSSSFCSGFALSRIGLGRLLALSCLLTAGSLLGYAASPRWPVMVLLAVVAGLGAGAIDAGINAYASLHLGPRLLNWLHACFGVGAATGPVIMSTVLQSGRPWQRGYLVVGLAQLLLAATFLATARSWADGESRKTLDDAAKPVAAPASATLRRGATWLGVLTFFLYTGLEASFGVWSYTLFTDGRGVSPAVAAASVSAFWGGLTGGRLLVAFAGAGLPVKRLLRGCLIVISGAAALVVADVSTSLSLAALALAGLASGPVFPSLISTTAARLGDEHTAGGVGVQVAAAALGQALIPAAMGVVADGIGIPSLAWMMLAVSVVVLAAHEALMVPAGPRAPRTALGDTTAS